MPIMDKKYSLPIVEYYSGTIGKINLRWINFFNFAQILLSSQNSIM